MDEKRTNSSSRSKNVLSLAGLLMVVGTVLTFGTTTYLSFNNAPVYYYTPPYYETVPREMKMGTYVYDHGRIANNPEYFDDLARMVDRVLIDISWSVVMRNDSYPNCFDMDKFTFYDQMFQNFSDRGIGIVIQFSPTRSPPSWLGVTLEMSSYRAVKPPQDPSERAHFIQMLGYYVNQTVNYFEGKSYFVELEYCLADEPNTADWADVMLDMYTTIKASSNTTVSLVLNNPDLYSSFTGSFDMITIDPYGLDHDNVVKIKKAHVAVNESKPVRVIISGMERDPGLDYYRIYRQMVTSWFMGAYDMWFWSYNSRWTTFDEDWYVVVFSDDGPIYTERADAIVNVRQDLKIFAEIEHYLKTGSNHTLIKQLETLQDGAYHHIMQNKVSWARANLIEAHLLLN
ncbi:MAG: hypothetical protein ACTSUE_03790 [Promethearchaeota archaeon]